MNLFYLFLWFSTVNIYVVDILLFQFINLYSKLKLSFLQQLSGNFSKGGKARTDSFSMKLKDLARKLFWKTHHVSLWATLQCGANLRTQKKQLSGLKSCLTFAFSILNKSVWECMWIDVDDKLLSLLSFFL